MKVLNIGSLNIDRVYGVDHFVRPGETIKTRTYAEACGGKGLNQSIALARSGAEVHHVGAVGADGGMLLDVLKASGVHTEGTKSLSGASGHPSANAEASFKSSIETEEMSVTTASLPASVIPSPTAAAIAAVFPVCDQYATITLSIFNFLLKFVLR